MAHGPRILVVEDEPTQRHLLVEFLRRHDYHVSGLADGHALRRAVAHEEPALVLLDLTLPGGEDGFSLTRYLRQQWPRTGIIMVTAAADAVDRITGLEIGADDYVPKPFEPRELLARVKSVLRRTTPGAAPTAGPRIHMGRRVLDLERRMLLGPDGTEERLSPGEFDLLRRFAENPNRPLSREWLLGATSHREADAFDRAIDLRVTRLRRKIEHDPGHPDAIRTVRGIGYIFVPPAS